MSKIKAFYSDYENQVFIVWLDNNPLYTDYSIIRNGKEIVSGKREDFHHPEEFDNDHRTNLFRKRSKHEWCYHDTDIQQYQEYWYQVVYRQLAEDGTELNASVTRPIRVYTG